MFCPWWRPKHTKTSSPEALGLNRPEPARRNQPRVVLARWSSMTTSSLPTASATSGTVALSLSPRCLSLSKPLLSFFENLITITITPFSLLLHLVSFVFLGGGAGGRAGRREQQRAAAAAKYPRGGEECSPNFPPGTRLFGRSLRLSPSPSAFCPPLQKA